MVRGQRGHHRENRAEASTKSILLHRGDFMKPLGFCKACQQHQEEAVYKPPSNWFGGLEAAAPWGEECFQTLALADLGDETQGLEVSQILDRAKAIEKCLPGFR